MDGLLFGIVVFGGVEYVGVCFGLVLSFGFEL